MTGMTDEEALALFPALREFVEAVNERNPEFIQACLHHTPPATLAVLAAGWIGDLQNENDRLRCYLEASNREAAKNARMFLEMRDRRNELRDIIHGRSKKRKDAA